MGERQLPELYPGWKTVRKLGSGSFGTVYEIERDLFGKIEKAALKCISIPQNDGDVEEMYSNGYDDASITAHFETYLANIVREYSLMVEMKGHTNVVYCDDIRYIPREDGIGWDITIKMELLTPLIKTLGPDFGEEQVIRLGKDLCRALVLCKDRDVVHRDIKPQNIFVSKTGDYKLGDFGIAKTVEQTTGGTKIGTYSYMAPEVYHNKPYGSSADIYSLGLVMYWLLNEWRLPFLPLPPKTPTYDETETARHRRFMGEELPAPKNGSDELKRIVLKACAFDPKDRFASAQEMLDVLERIGQAEPVLSKVEMQEETPQSLDEKILAWSRTVPIEAAEDKTMGLFFTSKSAEEETKTETITVSKVEAPETEHVFDAEAVSQEDRTAAVFEKKPAAEPKTSAAPAWNTQSKPECDSERTAPSTIEVPKQEKQSDIKTPHKKNKVRIVKLVAYAMVALILIGSIIYTSFHIWSEATCVARATCFICGETRGELINHNWISPDCINAGYCSICDAEGFEAWGHNWTEATNDSPATCRECGITMETQPGPTVENTEVKDVTLKVWAPMEDQVDEGSWLNVMLRQFEQEHPEYRVTWDLGYCGEGDMMSMVSSDPAVAPDVFLFAHDQTEYLIQFGVLTKLEGEYLEQVKRDVSQVHLNTVTAADNGVYGFPVASNTWFMYYNKNVFSEADVKSLDQMLDKGTVAFQMRNAWFNMAFFSANGCTLFGEQGNDASAGVQFGGQAGIDAAMKMVEVRDHYNFRDDDGYTGVDGMKNGTVDACFSGWWDFAGLYEVLGDDLGVASLPTVKIAGQEKQMRSFGGSRAIGVNPNAADHEAALRLAAFLASEQSQLLRFELRGIAPAATALLENPSVQASACAVAEMETMLHTSVAQPMISAMNAYWGPMGTLGTALADGAVTKDNVKDFVNALMEQFASYGM